MKDVKKLNEFLFRMRMEYRRCVAGRDWPRAALIRRFLRENIAAEGNADA